MPCMHRTVWMKCTIVSTSCDRSTCADIVLVLCFPFIPSALPLFSFLSLSCPFHFLFVSISFPVAFLSCQLPISSPHFLALPCAPQYFLSFPDFRQKAGSPSQQRAGRGNTGSPKTTFSGTSSNCRVVRGGHSVLFLLHMLTLEQPLLILQPLQKVSRRAPYRSKPRPFSVPPLLAYWTLLQNRSRGRTHAFSTTRHVFPSEIRYPRQSAVGVNCGSGAGFPQRSIHNVIRWRRLHGSLFKCWPTIRLH